MQTSSAPEEQSPEPRRKSRSERTERYEKEEAHYINEDCFDDCRLKICAGSNPKLFICICLALSVSLFMVLLMFHDPWRGASHDTSAPTPAPTVVPTSAPTAPPQRKQVFVFRHCVRAPSAEVKYGDPNFKQFSDYSANPYPTWPVPANWCTPNGLSSINGEGTALRGFGGDYTRGVRVFSDAVDRDMQTALHFLLGVQHEEEQKVVVDNLLFYAVSPDVGKPLCYLSHDTQTASEATVLWRMQNIPPPQPLASSAEALQAKLGRGSAPTIAETSNTVVDGKVTGSLYLMKSFSQAIFYAYASGLDYMAQLNVSLPEMYDFLSFQYHYRYISNWNAKEASEHANLLYTVKQELLESTAGVSLFIGHDGDLYALAMYFDLEWQAPPYVGPFPTPPGSGLLFERAEDGTVSSSFVYPVYNASDGTVNLNGHLHSVPAKEDMSFQAWSDTADQTLQRFPQGTECYQKVVQHHESARRAQP